MTTWLELAGAPAIDGLRFRLFSPSDDLAALARVNNAAETADGTLELYTPQSLANELFHRDDFVPERDIVVAEVDGSIIAFSERSRAIRGSERSFDSTGQVHPDWRRRGIGRALLRHAEAVQRARYEAEADWSSPASFGTWSPEDRIGYVALLAAEGYQVARWFMEMERPDLEAIPEMELPQGIELRPATRDQRRAVLLADFEAFLDHWGAREQTETDLQRMLQDPDAAFDLWQVGWAGDEVAGSVLPKILPEENRALGVQRGWLEHVSVRRPWRRHGLARALIVAALVALRERGMERAVLGVDAANPNGAVGIYERLGFRSIHRAMAFRKPIEPGLLRND